MFSNFPFFSQLAATKARMQTQSNDKDKRITELQEEIQTLQNTQASETSASSDLAEVLATVDKLNDENGKVSTTLLVATVL